MDGREAVVKKSGTAEGNFVSLDKRVDALISKRLFLSLNERKDDEKQQ